MTQTENTTVTTEHDEEPNSFVAMRRKVLGALAIGVVASACSSADEALVPTNAQAPGSSAPSTSALSATPSSQAVIDAAATGPELNAVNLPVAVDLDPLVVAPANDSVGNGSTAQGGATGNGAAPQSSSAGKSAVEQSSPAATAAETGAPASPATSASAAGGDVMTGASAASGSTSQAAAAAGTATVAPAKAETVIAGMGNSDSGAAGSNAGSSTGSNSAEGTTAAPAKPVTSTPPGEATTSTTAKPAEPTTPTTSAPPEPTTPIPSAAADVLLANRVTFGVTPAVLADIKRLGGGGFIENQLQRKGPDPEAEKRVAGFRALRMNPKQLYDIRKNKARDIVNQIPHSNLLRATYSKNQLFENMCHLWMDHFNVGIISDGGNQVHIVDYQENVIRRNAMGSFRDLLKATANSAAMLIYLDNNLSNANSPQGINENYGRELLELHTLGIDQAGKQIYTEADVRNASLAMSGWSTVRSRKVANYGQFEFISKYHHTGNISLLGGAWTRQGTTGKATGDSLLNFLASHPSTARHIAFKICRRFVSDSPSQALINSTAQVFLQNDTQLVPTLRHVLNSAEFAASAGKKIRRPFEHMVATLRALNANVPNDPTSKGALRLRATLRSMDHEPWYWPQPDGYPDTASDWLSTDGLSNRWTLGALLARNRVPDIKVDYAQFKSNSGTVGDLIAGLGRRFGSGGMTPQLSSAIAKGARVEVGAPATSLSNAQLADIIGLVLAHPIFQTR